MPTGPFWNTEDPDKPWGKWDPNAELVIPLEIEDWLAEMGTTYADHEIIAPLPLSCPNDARDDNVIFIRIKLADGASYVSGKKYPFTVRLIGAAGADGGGPQQDDRTLWLKVKDR